MYAPGHIGLALVAFTPLGYGLARRYRTRHVLFGLGGALACGLLPDIDLFLAGVSHRMITHTPVAALTAAVCLSGLGVVVAPSIGDLRRQVATTGAAAGLLGVGSHLLGDVVTPMGIRPLLPLSPLSVSFHLVAARNPAANATLLAGGTVVMLLALAIARGWRVPTPLPAVTWRRRT